MILLLRACAPRTALTGVFILISSIVIAASAVASEEQAESPPVSINGQATIELKVGVKQYLKGLELALIPEDLADDLKEIRDRRWLDQASRIKFNDGFFYLDLNSIGYFAVQNAVQRTKADNEGRFAFTSVPSGAYRIYAQYKSRYAAGYWLVPVTVTDPNATITQNINNENLQEIYNREIR